MKIRKDRLTGYCLLLLSTVFFAIVAVGDSVNTLKYFIELALLALTIIALNRETLIAANTLFLAYFCYTVALGPLLLLAAHTNYGYSYFTVILGSLLAFTWGNALVAHKKIRPAIEDKGIVRFSLSRKYVLRIIYAISLLAALYYLIQNRAYLLDGNLGAGRVEAMSGNGLLLCTAQLPILIVPMMYDVYFQGKRDGVKTISKWEVICLAGFSCIMLMVSGFRAPVMSLVICLAVLVIQKNKIRNSKIIALGITMIAMVEILGIFRSGMSGENISLNVFSSLSTSLIVNSINLKYVFNTFPVKTPFQYGYTYLINLIMLLPGPDQDFTLWLKDQIGISFAGGGVTPTVMGEFYINFGTVGIYVGMFLIGIAGVYIYRYFRRHSDTFLGVFYVWQFAHCVSGGVANVMVTVILYTIIYWVLMMFPVYKNSRYVLNGKEKY